MVFDWPTHMDYEGQHRAEKLSHIIVVAFGIVGWIIGYINQQFAHTIIVLGVGVLVAGLLTIPPWPMYRRKPLHWRKPRKEGVEGARKEREVPNPAQKQKKKK